MTDLKLTVKQTKIIQLGILAGNMIALLLLLTLGSIKLIQKLNLKSTLVENNQKIQLNNTTLTEQAETLKAIQNLTQELTKTIPDRLDMHIYIVDLAQTAATVGFKVDKITVEDTQNQATTLAIDFTGNNTGSAQELIQLLETMPRFTDISEVNIQQAEEITAKVSVKLAIYSLVL